MERITDTKAAEEEESGVKGPQETEERMSEEVEQMQLSHRRERKMNKREI